MLSFFNWNFCRYSTVIVRLHAPNAEFHRVNSLPTLCYFHFCMCMYVSMFVFYEVSYTWFWLHRQFCNLLFYVGRSHHLQKTTSKINNLNRVLQVLHVIECSICWVDASTWMNLKQSSIVGVAQSFFFYETFIPMCFIMNSCSSVCACNFYFGCKFLPFGRKGVIWECFFPALRAWRLQSIGLSDHRDLWSVSRTGTSLNHFHKLRGGWNRLHTRKWFQFFLQG